MDIQPPIFVQYSNTGVVAFKSVDQAIAKITSRDLERISGAWDSEGRRIHYERGTSGVEIVLVDADDWSWLRSALVQRLRQEGDEDLDLLDDETLVIRATERLRLRRWFELWKEATYGMDGGPA